MNQPAAKITKRGFVMTGGGAKGLYEAGVINAFHLCGMEFDVITGSSIGAINAIFFAEYLLRKKRLPAEERDDPERAIEALDPLVRAFQQAWWRLPEAGIIDDSEDGPLGQLKNDLIRANLDLPLLVRLGWWWSDPNRWDVPPLRVWPHFLRLGRELVERLGDGRELFNVFKREQHGPVEAMLRAYLSRFGIEQSLVPATPNTLRDYFTTPQPPLTLEHLNGDRPTLGNAQTLIEAQRTFREYWEEGIDVRLTRANYRTGRLELSAYTPIDDFITYLEGRDATRELTLGSSRLVLPGNPNAINAAIASGRFPGVFAPFPITEIYPESDDAQREPENALLYQILRRGLDAPEVREALYPHYVASNAQSDREALAYIFERLYPYWTDLPFPRIDDTYIDGGAIDNTPTNSAVDAIREAIDLRARSRRDYNLDLYVVFLHSEPNPGTAKTTTNPALYQIVTRTLKIQGAAKLTSDAGVVTTINRFGNHGEELGRQLQLLLQSVRQTLDSLAETVDAGVVALVEDTLLQQLQALADARGLGTPAGDDLQALLQELDDRSRELLSRRLPLNVTPVEIYPDDMQLETLQFTERLGFRSEKAIEAMTMGCYNTMWRLRRHLESKEASASLDEVDERALQLARKWMGFKEWPRSEKESEALEGNWQCQRTRCAFHPMHCRHGRRARRVARISISQVA
ncbi:MAG: patatin-like phospholipase family protein [Chloroflexota bacterium]